MILNQKLFIPLDSIFIFTFSHKYIDSKILYNDYNEKQFLKLNYRNNIFGLGLNKYGKNFEFLVKYNRGNEIFYEKLASQFSLKFKGIRITPNYNQINKDRSSVLISDTTNISLKSIERTTKKSIDVVYENEKISVKHKRNISSNNSNKVTYLNGFLLDLGPSGFQNDTKVLLNVYNFKFWISQHYCLNTTETPMLYKSTKLGKITALDDTLSSFQVGINRQSHTLKYGRGNWRGKMWISQFSPNPFTPVWAILFGAKYYLDSKYHINFINLGYGLQKDYNRWMLNFEANYLKLSGEIYGEQWVISWPVELLNNRLKIKVDNLDILENRLKINYKFSNQLNFEFHTNIFVPLNLDFKLEPNIISDDPIDPIEKKNEEKMSGGVQYGITFNYFF